MAEGNSSYPSLQKGEEVIVVIEFIINDTLFVCLKHGSKEFRGALLDSEKRQFPPVLCFGGKPSAPGSTEESCKSVDSVKGTSQEATVSSTVNRYTYHKDVFKLYENSVDVHPKPQIRPIRSKTVRDIRLRPRQTLCVNCKCAIHENGKGLSTRGHQNPSKHKSPSRNTPARPTRRSSVSSVQPNSHIMDSPRMSLRKRGYNLLGDGPQPKVKLTRCDSDANLVKPVKRTSSSHRTAANLARARSNDRSRNGCKTEVKQSKVDKGGKPMINAKATPMIKISIGERSVIEIPPKRSDADDVSDLQESQPSTQLGHFPERELFTRLEHKKLKKSNKKMREKDKEAGDSDVPSRLQHRKHKRKHKHRHASLSEPEVSSSPRGSTLSKDPVSSSQDPEESFKENKSFRTEDVAISTYEDDSEEMDMEDTENSSPLREDLVHQNRPRLLYTLSQNDGLIQIDSTKKDKKEYPLRSRSSLDALHSVGETNLVRLGSVTDTHHVQALPNSPNVCSNQNSPYLVRSNQSSPQKSYHESPLFRSGQDPLQAHNYQDSMSARSNPTSPCVWSSQESVHNQSSQDYFMWNNSSSVEGNGHSQTHSEDSSEGASSDPSSGSDSGSESDNEASNSEFENCSGPPNSSPIDSQERHSQGSMIMKFMNVQECDVAEGRKVRVGDVVWGKVQGFPWWPGRVDSITMTLKDNDIIMGQNAHVLWFGSTTASHMDCRSLLDFSDNYKDRYNKKKRGMYKKAIREATEAAQKIEADRICLYNVQPAPEDPGSVGAEKVDFDAYDLLD